MIGKRLPNGSFFFLSLLAKATDIALEPANLLSLRKRIIFAYLFYVGVQCPN